MSRAIQIAAVLLSASTFAQGCTRCYEYIEIEPGSGARLNDGGYDLIVDEILDDSCGFGEVERSAVSVWFWSDGAEAGLDADALRLSGWQRDGAISLEGPLWIDAGLESDWEDEACDSDGPREDARGGDGLCGLDESYPEERADGWIRFEAEVLNDHRASGTLSIVYDDGAGPGCEVEVAAHIAPVFERDPVALPDDEPIDG